MCEVGLKGIAYDKDQGSTVSLENSWGLRGIEVCGSEGEKSIKMEKWFGKGLDPDVL